MKTVLYQDVVNQAAESAMRTRDKLPASEAIMLQGFIATELEILWPAQAWPELIPALAQVDVANRQFSKNEGQAGEMGDVLGVYLQNPQAQNYLPRPLAFYEGAGTVWLDCDVTQAWVEYLLPCPDLMLLNAAALAVLTLPMRFRNVLALKAAAHLLGGDGDSAGAGVRFGLAEKYLAAEINRLPPSPPWRNALRMVGRRLNR